MVSVAAACNGDAGPAPVDLDGVYVVDERLVSSTCTMGDMALEDTPANVEIATELGYVMLYPCERVEGDICHAFPDNAYPVGSLDRRITDGYEVELLSLRAGTASCFASFIVGRTELADDHVIVIDERRGGIVPDVSPADCNRESVGSPEALPCLWYEELTLSAL